MNIEEVDLPGGPFEVHEVYFEHDGPRLLSLRATRWPMFYMLNCVDEDEDALTLTYVAVVLDQTRFDAVRGGALDLRSAYVEAGPGDCYTVVWQFDENDASADAATVVAVSDIQESWLPRPGAALSLPTDTAEPFAVTELPVLADSSLRSVGAIELEQAGQPLTEFSIRALAQIGSAIQDNVDALADEGFEGRANRPSEEVQLSVIGLRAASFVLLVGTDKRGRLFDRPDIFASVFEDFIGLVSAAQDPHSGEMIERLLTHKRRTRSRFRLLLRRLNEAGSGLTVHATPLGRETRTTGVSAEQVRETLEVFGSVPDEVDEIEIRRGAVLALNLTRKSFEIVDLAAGRKYSGYMTDEAKAQADGLRVSESSLVRATVRTVFEFAADDERVHCTLLSVQAID